MLPLVVVLAVSLAKEAVEDHKRSQKDAEARHCWSQQAVFNGLHMQLHAKNTCAVLLMGPVTCDQSSSASTATADRKGGQLSLCLLSLSPSREA